MIWTAWNNGEHHASGAGYGFKLDAADRDRHFKRGWRTVFIEIPERVGVTTVEVGVTKRSFWDGRCRELINRDIGRWLRDGGHAPWPKDRPPKFLVEAVADRHFRVKVQHTS